MSYKYPMDTALSIALAVIGAVLFGGPLVYIAWNYNINDEGGDDDDWNR